MTSSIDAVRASAIVVSDAGAANAQQNTETRTRTSGTVCTGDVIPGKEGRQPTLTSQASKLARSIFSISRACRCPGGQYWYVSVIVDKDGRLGKRFSLMSGVHGDEMSSIRTVRTVIDPLDPAQISGTVTAMLPRPAVESVQRRWPNSGRGAGLIDMNREWPGDENGASATSRHAGLLFNRLLKLSCDLAIDFPTGMTGLEVGDRTLPDVKTVMDLYPTGQI